MGPLLGAATASKEYHSQTINPTMKVYLLLCLIGLVVLAAASPRRFRDDEDCIEEGEETTAENEELPICKNGDDRPPRRGPGGGNRRRGGGGGNRDDSREEGECREVDLEDGRRADCQNALRIVEEGQNCEEEVTQWGDLSMMSPKQMCEENAGKTVHVCMLRRRYFKRGLREILVNEEPQEEGEDAETDGESDRSEDGGDRRRGRKCPMDLTEFKPVELGFETDFTVPDCMICP
eukprot:maker-scaffold83_size396513-snap-gene-2.30 protein:Tk00965 transcript:maker-scaffold83_size396513-snap-gene-2.30-mRNA-1 annotation:"hypothetical protein"